MGPSPQESGTKTPGLKRNFQTAVNPPQSPPLTTDHKNEAPLFVPILCLYNRAWAQNCSSSFARSRSNHAKRKSHSFFASSRSRCLGVPLERILLWTKEKASQNRYRDARYSQRRISRTEVDRGSADRHQY